MNFSLNNDSDERQRVQYSLRAHRVKPIPGGDGAKRNEIVEQFTGEAELAEHENRKLTQTISVSAKPTQVVASARPT